MALRRPPLLEGQWSSARRKPTSRRHYSSSRRKNKPNARTLSPQRPNWLVAGKALLKHPLGPSPNHKSTTTSPTNKNNSCLEPKGGAGHSQAKQS